MPQRSGESYREGAANVERALQEVAGGLAAAREPDDQLTRITDLARSSVGADSAYLERIDRAKGEVEVVSIAGGAPPGVGTRVPYPGSLAEGVIELDHPEIVPPGGWAERAIAAAIGDGCAGCGMLVTPLVHEGRPIGALILVRAPASGSHFAPRDAARVRAFADLAAIALGRVILREELSRTAREIREGHRRFSLLVQGVRDYAILMLDEKGRIVSWNEGAERIHGYTRDEVLGRFFEIFLPRNARRRGHSARELAVAESAGQYQEEGWRLRKDGSRFWAHVTMTVLRDDAGELLGFSKVVRDLSERRRHELEVRRLLDKERLANRKVATLFERITDGVLALDPDWRLVLLNPAARAFITDRVGGALEERVGGILWEVVPGLLGTEVERRLRLSMETQSPCHFVTSLQGGDVWLEVHAYPSKDGLSVYFRDVTEHKRAKRAAEVGRSRLRSVLEALPVGVLISDDAGRVVEANRAAYELWGIPSADRARPDLLRADRLLDPDTANPLPAESWPPMRVPRTGETIESLEIELDAYNGVRRSLLLFARPIVEPDRRAGAVTVMLDITDRQRLLREARTARVDAERANRAKSEFLAMMSHEIRTPINAVMGYTDLLKMGITGPVNRLQREQLERIASSSAHLLSLINDVLDMAKVESGRLSVRRAESELRHVVLSALALVRPQAVSRGVTLLNECEPGTPVAYCGDEDRVRQILVNLLSNAVKFTDAGGRVRIRCRRVEGGGDGSAGSTTRAVIEIEDDGIGIPDDRVEAIFQPFVQADVGHTRTRDGTGLGLAISRQLARLMEGDVTVESRVGQGSTFTLWLPVADEEGERLDTGLGREQVGTIISRTLREEGEGIVVGFAERIRRDPDFADAARIPDADLHDHLLALLADVAQSLTSPADNGRSQLLRDGSEIQRVIAELHGAQRHRLGWSLEQIRREYEILGEEIERRIGDLPIDCAEADRARVMERLFRCLDAAQRASIVSYEAAAKEAV